VLILHLSSKVCSLSYLLLILMIFYLYVIEIILCAKFGHSSILCVYACILTLGLVKCSLLSNEPCLKFEFRKWTEIGNLSVRSRTVHGISFWIVRMIGQTVRDFLNVDRPAPRRGPSATGKYLGQRQKRVSFSPLVIPLSHSTSQR
jgi:hypothetical protein